MCMKIFNQRIEQPIHSEIMTMLYSCSEHIYTYDNWIIDTHIKHRELICCHSSWYLLSVPASMSHSRVVARYLMSEELICQSGLSLITINKRFTAALGSAADLANFGSQGLIVLTKNSPKTRHRIIWEIKTSRVTKDLHASPVHH